ncbi:FUSC family protein [Halopolyspora algeriensis]|nr:aromatic acid exporter family protein [Halopolyspora algeriensis]
MLATRDGTGSSDKASLRQRLRRRGRNLVDDVRRAARFPGAERERLLLIGKSALAATIAWFVANNLLGAPSATFAPFTALLMVQSTIQLSMQQSWYYVLAVSIGVSATAVLGPLLGIHPLTFLVLVLFTLLLGFWRRLGSQGTQVSVAAVFAYATYAQVGPGINAAIDVFIIAGLVVLGATVGVVVNMVLFPPTRYRSAQRAVDSLGDSLGYLIGDIGCRLWQGAPEPESTQDWTRRAQDLSGQVEQTSQALENAVESSRFNPRRLLTRQPETYSGGRTLFDMFQRCHDQLLSITRGLNYVGQESEIYDRDQREFLDGYAKVFVRCAQGLRHAGWMHDHDAREREQFERDVAMSEKRCRILAEQADRSGLDISGKSPIYGYLLADLQRMVSELENGRDEFGQDSNPSGRSR